uniref:BTB domain-containing protein n=1 Tax=Panagrellus redivivus TaxID=6233 RepID=A0A7E4UUN4_PANRE
MSTIQEIATHRAGYSVNLDKGDLSGLLPNGFRLQTPELDVTGTSGFKWSIQWYPAGVTTAEKDYISLYLKVNKPVKTTFQFRIIGSLIHMSGTHRFTYPSLAVGFPKYASHEKLLPLFQHGKLTIACSVSFYIPVQRELSVPCMYQLFGHVPTDVELVVGSGSVPAHKNFLSLISPVFQAMFSHNTTEAKSNRVNITEFDYVSVQSAVDYCYGRKLNPLFAETAVNMLRFCDKYFITAAIEELEKLTVLIPSTGNFCHVVRYAYDCNRSALLTDCCKFFKEHQYQIKVLKMFVELPPTLVVDILKKAFDLKTKFDVLYYAHKNGINFVVDHLEEPLIKSMSMQDFCPAAKFAWKCSRRKLQHVCAQFLNDNREMVTDAADFLDLPSETMRNVLKTSHALKRSQV